MFKLADNKKIGAYLKRSIEKKGYRSVRNFGKKCLEERKMPTDEEAINNMSNRLSQISSGNKGIQLEDLPVFSKLLDMSCEEILSAGECFYASSNHITNYSIAFSRDKKEWDAYIKRKDKLILNADEYGKTVIDYALDFENYDFLKYLMERKYIWFIGTDDTDLLYYNFGAGTSIERNPLLMQNLNLLDTKMKENYDLRMKMITLAIKRNDSKMLTELRAREIPSFYMACYLSCTPPECEKYFDAEIISALTEASDEMLKYFSEEIEISDRLGITNRFMFPFINKLIEVLIETNNDYVIWILKNAIKHNQFVLDKLNELLTSSINYYKNLDMYYMQAEKIKDDTIKRILRNIDYFGDGEIICYRTPDAKDGIVTNLVLVNATSKDVQTNHLIQELNESYDKIRNIRPII